MERWRLAGWIGGVPPPPRARHDSVTALALMESRFAWIRDVVTCPILATSTQRWRDAAGPSGETPAFRFAA